MCYTFLLEFWKIFKPCNKSKINYVSKYKPSFIGQKQYLYKGCTITQYSCGASIY